MRVIIPDDLAGITALQHALEADPETTKSEGHTFGFRLQSSIASLPTANCQLLPSYCFASAFGGSFAFNHGIILRNRRPVTSTG